MADQASRLTSGKASGKAPGFRQTPEARGPSLSERQQNLSECHCPADAAVLAFGAVRLRRIQSAVRAATGTGTLTPSIRDWSLDPYAVD